MDYTINGLPNEANTINASDELIVWQGMTKKIKFGKISKDLVTQSNSVFVANGNITESKTVVLPESYTNNPSVSFKVIFPNGHNNSSSVGAFTLNGVAVVVNQNGTLVPIPIHTMTEGGSTVYKVLQPNTVLEMYYTADYDGNETPAFVVIGNPIVLSSSDYTIYANGKKSYPYNDTKPVSQLFTSMFNIAANNIADVLFDITKPGYTPIMIAPYNSGGNDVVFSNTAIRSDTSAAARLRNFSSSSLTLQVSVSVLYTKILS